MSLSQVSLAHSTDSRQNSSYNFYVHKYECKIIDEFEIPTGEGISISKYIYFSNLNWWLQPLDTPLVGRIATASNDTIIEDIVQQVGELKEAFFFQDKNKNRFRVTIHNYKVFENHYLGFLVNTIFEKAGQPNTYYEKIRYQQDLACEKIYSF